MKIIQSENSTLVVDVLCRRSSCALFLVSLPVNRLANIEHRKLCNSMVVPLQSRPS